MNLNIRVPFRFSRRKDKQEQPLVRVAGSLEGSAIWEESSLDDLKHAVKEASARRPFRYDIVLSQGRFIIMLSENLISLSGFSESPESVFTRDLQEICDSLPESQKSSLSSTFRCLWRHGDEVTGAAFVALPSGTMVSEKRTRSDSEYDRMVEEQDYDEYIPPARQFVPKWVTFSLAVAAVVLFSLFWIWFGPDARYRALRKALPQADMGEFEPLIEINSEELGRSGMILILTPKVSLDVWIREHDESPATDALRNGAIFMQILDEEGVILDSIPLRFHRYSGEAPVQVRTRAPQLVDTPAAVSFRF